MPGPSSTTVLSAPPPLEQPISDIRTGKTSWGWGQFFSQVWNNVQTVFTDDSSAFDSVSGGQYDTQVDELQKRTALTGGYAGEVDVAIKELQARLAQISGYQGECDAAIAELQMCAAQATGYQGECDPAIQELQALVALIQEGLPGSASAYTIYDTHLNRTNYSAIAYPGWIYFESDRKVAYVSNAGQWYYATGVYADVSGNRPSGLTQYEDKYLFESTDHFVKWKWFYNGGTPYWLFIGGEDNGTLANINTAGGIVGGPTMNDVGMYYCATDVGHRFIWNGTQWNLSDGEMPGWTTFSPTLFGPASWFQLVSPSGAVVTGITDAHGGSTGSATFGASVSPITGSGLFVRL